MKKIVLCMMSLFSIPVVFAQIVDTIEISAEDLNRTSDYVDMEILDWNDDGTPDIVRLQADGSVNALIRKNVLEIGLVAHWTFDDSTNLGEDSSGNNHNGTGFGSLTALSSGKVGGAVDLGSSSARIEIPAHTDFNFDTDDVTFSLWAKRTSEASGSNLHRFLAWGTSAFEYYGAGSVFYVSHPGASYSSSYTWGLNQWTHFVFTRENGNASYYANGVKIYGPVSHSGAIDMSSSIGIGSFIGGGVWPLHGSMDDVRIYNRALTDSEVCALYTLGSEVCQ